MLDYDKANELAGDTSFSHGRPSAIFKLAQRAYNEIGYRKLDAAIADLNKAIDLSKPNSNWFRLRAYAKSLKGDLAGSIADYTNAIEIAKQNVESPAIIKALYRDQAEIRDQINTTTSQQAAIQPSATFVEPAQVITMSDESGKTYSVSQADYDRLHPIYIRLGQEDDVIKQLNEKEDQIRNKIEIDRSNLDNTDQQSVDIFNDEVNRFNLFQHDVGGRIDSYNAEVNSFNAELYRVGTAVN